MKIIPLSISFLLTIKGIYAGQAILYSTPFAYGNIRYEMESNNIPVLDTTSNESAEEWLVLAQKYRENGTVAVNKERNPALWQDPEFISSKRLSELGVVTNGLNEFAGDSGLAAELKSKCAEVLDNPYSRDLFEKASKWCSLTLSKSVKSILKFQKENGDCRFWIVRSSKDSTGWFIWEFLENFGSKSNILNSFNNDLQSANYHETITDKEDYQAKRGRDILNRCKNVGSGKFLELSYFPLPNYGLGSGHSYIYAVNNKGNGIWGVGKPHKLAPASF